ncbi:MAG: IS200/IS605 family transposase [Elusimicrobia bacterium]|nr:IS200/IS605 family transposase [Elusimicrobiota bacterium]
MRKYWTGCHTKHRLQYHLVWVPKYRKRVLLGKVASRLKGLLCEAAKVNGWAISELSVQRDHAHMLLQIGPETSVSRVMQLIKGGTSVKLRKEFPELEEFLWGDNFWADGYFAETVGSTQEETIRKHIRDQGMPHAASHGL